jgi:predicted permease
MRPRGIRRLFRFSRRTRPDIDADVREEFAFHLEMRQKDLAAGGMSLEAARAQALREFGDVDGGTTACAAQGHRMERRITAARFFGELRQDLTYALRLVRRSPAFSGIAVLTLALGIGANTAVFSLFNALILKPLPVAEPGRLVRLYAGESGMSWPNIQDIRERAVMLDDVIAQRNVLPALSTGGDPFRVTGAAVSSNYFEVLGVAPLAGRPFSPRDPRKNLVVIGERLWRGRLNASPDVIGTTVTLDGRSYEIAAVMPRGFRGMSPAGFGRDVWIPLEPLGEDRRVMTNRATTAFEAYGRLRQGVTNDEASAALRAIGAVLKNENPGVNQRFDRLELLPTSGLMGLRGISALVPVFAFVTLAAVISAVILLVACANLAGLLLARGAARSREIAVRVALGAGRRRIIRQLLTESVVLAMLGGLGGLLVANWITSAVPLATSQLPFPVEFDLSVDRRVLLYAVALACLASIVFGLAPARSSVRASVASTLKVASGDVRRQRLRAALVVAQVSACSALLVWGGLFARSLGNVARVDPGFDPENVLLVELPLDQIAGTNASADSRVHAARVFHERARHMPGVESVGMTFAVPLAFTGRAEYEVRMLASAQPEQRRVMANTSTPGYFTTLRIPFVAGRDFDWTDRAGAPGVVIVNETAAMRFWNGNAVGQRLEIPERDEWVAVEVIGVVRDSKYWTLGEEIQPTVYTPFAQRFSGNTLFVRTRDMQATRDALRNELRRIAPHQPVEIQRMVDAIAVAVLPARIGALITTSFGVVAMLLAAMGVYGIVAFSVAQRTREIGVRKAIGARTVHLVGALAGRSLLLVFIGLGTGVLAGCTLARAFGGLIVGVSPFDAATVAGVTLIVLGAALAATLTPTLRASRIDPLIALRVE